MSAIVDIDTLAVNRFQTNPVDFENLGSINVSRIVLDTLGTILPRDRVQHFYTLNKDTLATLIFTVFQTDSTWLFGINGFEVEKFECRDKRMPMHLGLKVGASLDVFEKQLGRFETNDDVVYTKCLGFDGKEIQVTLETEDEDVTGVLINAANSLWDSPSVNALEP